MVAKLAIKVFQKMYLLKLGNIFSIFRHARKIFQHKIIYTPVMVSVIINSK
jgi:hypothetical protein